MSSAMLWKSLAGVTSAVALVLGGAGIAGASTVAPTGAGASRPAASEPSPMPDCHSAEHAGLGMIVNCSGEQKA